MTKQASAQNVTGGISMIKTEDEHKEIVETYLNGNYSDLSKDDLLYLVRFYKNLYEGIQ